MELRCGDLPGEAPVEHLSFLRSVADRTDATVQGFDARYIVGPVHLKQACTIADRAIERGEAIADERAMELLLYTAGRRQINRALELGLKDSPHPVVLFADGGDETAAAELLADRLEQRHPCDGSLADREHVRSFFEINDREVATGAALSDLVLERVALLAINR